MTPDDFEFRVRIPPRLLKKREMIDRLSEFAGWLASDESREPLERTTARILVTLREYPVEDREVEDALSRFVTQLESLAYTVGPGDQKESVREIALEAIAEMEENVRALHKRLTDIEAADGQMSRRFYHGTKADLKLGDLITPGYNSNFGKRKEASFVYLTGSLDAATWGAELALGDGRGRIYIVEPTGAFEDDPNLTDKKYPGNPTKSYRTRDPLRVTGEVTKWQGHSPERLKEMKDHLARLKELGVEAIED